MADIKKSDVQKAFFNAVVHSFYNNIVRKTPISSIQGEHLQDKWELEPIENGIAIKNPDGLLVNILEFGSKPHKILPKNKKALAWGPVIGAKNGSVMRKHGPVKVVHHPGTKGKFWIMNTFNDKSIQKQFEDTLEAELKKKLKI